jgi:hypothetical protein
MHSPAGPRCGPPLAIPMNNNTVVNPGAQTEPQQLLEILARGQFDGLKAILLSLGSEPGILHKAIQSTRSYQELLQRVGYQVTLTNQIHIQDCYSRVGPAGGIKAVLPYYDIPTQGSLPTLVNFDATITTTPKSVAFFDKMLVALKTELTRSKPLPQNS